MTHRANNLRSCWDGRSQTTRTKINPLKINMTFYIIRHAHKEQGNYYNPRLRHQDEPISQMGRADSLKLWPYLCDKQISAIYISGYLRTKQTIEFVAEQSGLAPTIDERLNEIDNGLI